VVLNGVSRVVLVLRFHRCCGFTSSFIGKFHIILSLLKFHGWCQCSAIVNYDVVDINYL